MCRPATLDDVVALVRRSGLVAPDALRRFLDQFTWPDPPSPAGVFARMVGAGLLTHFQAGELAEGRTGLWVGPYRVRDELGRGGMGRVYLADAPAGGRVAVKVLSAGLRGDPATRERVRREARAAAAVGHPNVVRVLDLDPDHDPPYLVMEYVDGVSLQAAVARRGTFTAGEAAAVGVGVAEGLAPAAAIGLVHRDIKPANVLVDRRGGVKVLDLGVARFASDPVSRRLSVAVVVGTLDYLAPEQAVDSSGVDPRADLYSLGATLYFLLAGHPPYPDDDLARKLARKRDAEPTPAHVLRPDVPEGLSAAISQLMARDPADRYPDPAAAAAALRPWADPGPDFPARLFAPPPAADETLHDPPTSAGSDATPVPQPPTRRVLHAHTHRPAPASPSPLPPPSPATAPAPEPAEDTGAPTLDLSAPAVPAGGSRANWWWLGLTLIGFTLAAVVLAALGRRHGQ
jgi:serine/threonine-protein kinase